MTRHGYGAQPPVELEEGVARSAAQQRLESRRNGGDDADLSDVNAAAAAIQELDEEGLARLGDILDEKCGDAPPEPTRPMPGEIGGAKATPSYMNGGKS